MMQFLRLALLLASAAGMVVWALEQPIAPDTYGVNGGSYRIRVEPRNGDLAMVEPNRTSTPSRLGDVHFFRNPDASSTFGLRAAGERALDAFDTRFWIACTAAAQMHATSNGGAFIESVGLPVQMLKPILAAPRVTPYADATPQGSWPGQ